VSRAAFASVLIGPRTLGASLVAARCASSSAAAAVTAYGEATRIHEYTTLFMVLVDWKPRLSPVASASHPLSLPSAYITTSGTCIGH
jgi:hypothetical protein